MLLHIWYYFDIFKGKGTEGTEEGRGNSRRLRKKRIRGRERRERGKEKDREN